MSIKKRKNTFIWKKKMGKNKAKERENVPFFLLIIRVNVFLNYRSNYIYDFMSVI